MSAPPRAGYHHGDLRATLLTTAMQLLEEGEPFSLREVARRAGVSSSAPYRHFPDRPTLESALAAEGYRDLRTDLTRGRPAPASVADLAEFAVAYVDFALRRPALFRLMFGNECDDTSDERVEAVAAVHELLAQASALVFPHGDATTLATAGWALAHGLACLHLDGKLAAGSREEIADQVRSTFTAALSAGGANGTSPR